MTLRRHKDFLALAALCRKSPATADYSPSGHSALPWLAALASSFFVVLRTSGACEQSHAWLRVGLPVASLTYKRTAQRRRALKKMPTYLLPRVLLSSHLLLKVSVMPSSVAKTRYSRRTWYHPSPLSKTPFAPKSARSVSHLHDVFVTLQCLEPPIALLF